jgi:hypothetical protein
MTGDPIRLSTAEVAILERLRAAELISEMAWFDDHAWKLLTGVIRQLAKRPAQYQHKQQKSYGETRR